MYRSLLLLPILTFFLFAKMELYPVKACALYDNLRHTKNTHQRYLDMSHSYEMIDHYKGQYLLRVRGESPTLRWVDDRCLRLRLLKGTPLYQKLKSSKDPIHQKSKTYSDKASDNLLALSWHNAFCETHHRKKECRQSFSDFFRKRSFTLHGLWPQPKSRVYCNIDYGLISADRYGHWSRLPEPKIDNLLKKRLQKVMPGVLSKLHRHEWIKHGTCYGTDAQHYFEDAITLTEAVRESKLARFFQKHVGKRVSIEGIKRAFEESFGQGTAKSLEMKCRDGLITEIWLHLYGKGSDIKKLLKNAKPVRSRCQYGIIDKPGIGK